MKNPSKRRFSIKLMTDHPEDVKFLVEASNGRLYRLGNRYAAYTGDFIARFSTEEDILTFAKDFSILHLGNLDDIMLDNKSVEAAYW